MTILSTVLKALTGPQIVHVLSVYHVEGTHPAVPEGTHPSEAVTVLSVHHGGLESCQRATQQWLDDGDELKRIIGWHQVKQTQWLARFEPGSRTGFVVDQVELLP